MLKIKCNVAFFNDSLAVKCKLPPEKGRTNKN